jgi:hypothetical protein
MKKIAILVIAAVNQPVYVHYVRSYWTEVIKYVNAEKPNIDVYLLLERDTEMDAFREVEDQVIQDTGTDFDQLCPAEFRTLIIPGILSKTIHAFELLQDKYDVFFRTNLSSLIRISAFEKFVQEKDSICYSGGAAWVDYLRKNLVMYGYIGADKGIKSLSDLDDFESDTFISGSGYFLSAEEVRSLLERKKQIRYDIVDDVSIGLMFKRHEVLHGFTENVEMERSPDNIAAKIRKSEACHIRLQHFPLALAEAVWHRLKDDPVWR